jgi:hypothetical protein
MSKQRKCRRIRWGDKQHYYDYLLSSGWQGVKQRYLDSPLPNDCYICGLAYASSCFDFHHRSYSHLGCERLMDIVPVCRPCHGYIHEEYDKAGRQNLWRVTKLARRSFRRKPVTMPSS